MKASIAEKLHALCDRFDEVSALLSDPDVIAHQQQFRELSKEYAQMEPIVHTYRAYEKTLAAISESSALLKDEDAEMRAMAKEELKVAEAHIEQLEKKLQLCLLPKDPNDEKNVYLEVRAGTGGHEAAIFAGDLFRMYCRYAEIKKWQVEVVSASEGDHGGYKEVIARISGANVYSQLKFESGAHRVQRVPETESQGRVHTSACTVAIMPEADEIDAIDINPADLRVDTYRASGAGGQHINKTDSAVRITHIPTGVVVECQDERSQHKNRARAMSLLQTKLLDAQIQAQQKSEAQMRRNLVGSGDRSERIRTYNFPQGRVTDHRINLTLYKLDEIMTGELDAIITPLTQEYQADLLALLGVS